MRRPSSAASRRSRAEARSLHRSRYASRRATISAASVARPRCRSAKRRATIRSAESDHVVGPWCDVTLDECAAREDLAPFAEQLVAGVDLAELFSPHGHEHPGPRWVQGQHLGDQARELAMEERGETRI